MGVNANKLSLPTIKRNRNRNQIAVALSYRVEFWLFALIVILMIVGLCVIALATSEYAAFKISLQEAIEYYLSSEMSAEEASYSKNWAADPQ